jgi:hypothetical protein
MTASSSKPEDKCPWDLVPLTVEQAIKTFRAVSAWEAKNGPAPDHWKPVLSVEFMLDLLYRFETLEEEVWQSPFETQTANLSHYGDSRTDPYLGADGWDTSTF